jgi:hypothetical protein
MFLGQKPSKIRFIFLGQPKNITDEYNDFFLKKCLPLSASPARDPPKQEYTKANDIYICVYGIGIRSETSSR